mgnify:FL=1
MTRVEQGVVPLEQASERLLARDPLAGIPLFVTVGGDVTGLPEPVAGTIYIVSLLVRQAVPHRLDVLSPGQLVRDSAGQPVGCIGLDANW